MEKKAIMNKIGIIENSLTDLNNERFALLKQIDEIEQKENNLLTAKIIELAKIENVRFQILDSYDYDDYRMTITDKNIELSDVDSTYVSIEDIIKYIL